MRVKIIDSSYAVESCKFTDAFLTCKVKFMGLPVQCEKILHSLPNRGKSKIAANIQEETLFRLQQ